MKTGAHTPMNMVGQGIVVGSEPGTDRQSCAFPQVAVLPGGRWLVGCRAAPSKNGTAGQRVLLMVSDDAGRSWSPGAAPFAAPALEGRPGQFRVLGLTALGGMRVLATLYWVDNSDPALPFFNEQTEGLLDSRILFAESADGGRTWSALWDTGVPGQPAPVVSLRDGRLAMVYVDRTAAPAIRARISADNGHTWPEKTILSIYESVMPSQTVRKDGMADAWSEMGKFSVGLPATAALPDGGFLVVYYAGASTDCTSVKWARIAV